MREAFSDSRRESTGGRRRARRLPLSVPVAFATLLAAAAPSFGGDEPLVIVHEQEGVYRVTARFTIPEPPAAARAVLTDYEEIPRFMPGVRTSIVRERVGGRAVVEQEAVSRVLMFSKRVHLVLQIQEEGHTLRFRDDCGRSFSDYSGAWRLTTANGGTVVTYELTARPAFDVPEFLLKRLLGRDAKDMIERLRAEIAARAIAMPR